jgi:hypothetical protein
VKRFALGTLDFHDDGTATFDKEPVTGPCKFVQRDGREVLLYRGRDPFHPKKTTQKGLVYLPKSGLLVGLGLEPNVFTR